MLLRISLFDEIVMSRSWWIILHPSFSKSWNTFETGEENVLSLSQNLVTLVAAWCDDKGFGVCMFINIQV